MNAWDSESCDCGWFKKVNNIWENSVWVGKQESRDHHHRPLWRLEDKKCVTNSFPMEDWTGFSPKSTHAASDRQGWQKIELLLRLTIIIVWDGLIIYCEKDRYWGKYFFKLFESNIGVYFAKKTFVYILFVF